MSFAPSGAPGLCQTPRGTTNEVPRRHVVLRRTVAFEQRDLGRALEDEEELVRVGGASFSVGGTVSGTTGPGLALRLNGGPPLEIAGDGPFTFPERLASGASYDVEVAHAPPGEVCSISDGAGTVAGADVTDVTVTCAPQGFTVGGSITGFETLPPAPGAAPQLGDLVLRLNADEEIRVRDEESYVFSTLLADGAPYEVTLVQEPYPSDVTLTNAAGTIAAADVVDADVELRGRWSVGGNHSGVTVPGVVLQLNGGDDIALNPGGLETFTWWDRAVHGEPYEVTILSEPRGLDCRIEDGSGVIDAAPATDIECICVREVRGVVGMDGDTPSVYTKLDTADGSAEPVSTNLAFGAVSGLAYDAAGRRLFGVDLETDSLVVIDPLDGSSSLVGDMGAVGVADVNGLAFDAGDGVLYGIASSAGGTCQLVRIDTETGQATPVGGSVATAGGVCLGLAFDPLFRRLYASTDTGELVTIDPETGAATASLPLSGDLAVSGLGYDALEGVLLGVSGEELFEIATDTGVASSRGPLAGFGAVEGLALAEDLREVYATDVGLPATSVVLQADACTAEARTVGTTGWRIEGMARDLADLRTWGITATNELLELDPNTGETRFVRKVDAPNQWETRCLVYNQFRQTLFTFAANPSAEEADVRMELELDGTVLMASIPTLAPPGAHFEALAVKNLGPTGATMYGVADPGPGEDCQLYLITEEFSVFPEYDLVGLQEVRGMAFDQDSLSMIPGDRFYVVDNASGQLARFPLGSGVITIIGPTAEAHALAWIAE